MDLADNEQQKSSKRRRSSSQPEATTELREDDRTTDTEAGATDPTMQAIQADAEDDNTRQFVTFKVGDEMFGLPIVDVQEIIRLPEVTRVPLSSANLQGLSNLRGKMLPIISLRRIFGFSDGKNDDATRVLVIQHESLLGFIVDQVSSVINVEVGQIEGTDGINSTVNTEYLTGIIKNTNGKMVMIVNFDRLVEAHFHLERAARAAQSDGMPSAVATDEAEDTDTLHLVSFSVENQEYAIPIEHVQEIVQVPDEITHVPNAASHVLGVISLRDKLLPLVSLRQLFSLSIQPLNEQSRIVVINLPSDQEQTTQVAVGIVTDTVNEVLRVDRGIVDDLPKVLSQDGSMMEITAIGRLDGGKRLVSFLSAANLLKHDAVREAITIGAQSVTDDVPQVEQDQSASDDDREDEKQVVIFRLGNEEYGVPIASVDEIVRVPESLTRIPTAPSFVEGIINLRGSVLPVIDQRRRFGMEEIARSDRQRIIVFNTLGTPTGFIVDSVSEVYKIADADIERTPSVSCGSGNVISQVANLEMAKRMILLLDVDKLLDTKESSQLAALAA